MAVKIQKSSDLDEIWFSSRLWCCELILIVGLLWRPKWSPKYKDPPIWGKKRFPSRFFSF
jgi:hypothetical protein